MLTKIALWILISGIVALAVAKVMGYCSRHDNTPNERGHCDDPTTCESEHLCGTYERKT
jgi:hypothetical protein